MKHFRFLRALAAIAAFSLAGLPARALDRPIYYPGTPAAVASKKRFEAILRQRTQPPVAQQPGFAAQLLPFLDDPFIGLRERAAQTLGELQDPIATAPLEERLALMQTEPVDDKLRIDPLTLQLALGHIAARALHGQAKIDAALSYTHYKWPDVVAASESINANNQGIRYSYGPDDIVLAFAVDLLYEMGKSGETIAPFAQQLTLSDAQKVKIQAASLSTKAEVQLELAFLVDTQKYVHAYQSGGQELTQHFAMLGAEANDAVLARLQDMKEHPTDYYGTEPDPEHPQYYRSRMMYSALLSVVGATCDPMMIPLLKYFEQLDNAEVSQSAASTRRIIEGY